MRRVRNSFERCFRGDRLASGGSNLMRRKRDAMKLVFHIVARKRALRPLVERGVGRVVEQARYQPRFCDVETSSLLLDGLDFFDLFVRRRAKLAESPRRYEHARFERSNRAVVRLNRAVEFLSDV